MTKLPPPSRGFVGALAILFVATICGPRAMSEEPAIVRIELPQSSYKVGEPFSFTLSASRTCNFIVFTIDAGDNVEIHDPSSNSYFMGPPVLTPGERRQIPVSGAPGHAVITPPLGSYEIGAVCGRDELSSYGLDVQAMTAPASRGRRGFKFYVESATRRFDRTNLGAATASFQISE